MALAETGRRSGSGRQATGLVTPSIALAANARTAVDRSGSLLSRAEPLGLARGESDSMEASMEAAGNGLARDLDRACAEIARRKRQSPGSVAPASQQTAAAMSPAEKALQRLQATAHANVLQVFGLGKAARKILATGNRPRGRGVGKL
jgi:hypothetical protein